MENYSMWNELMLFRTVEPYEHLDSIVCDICFIAYRFIENPL